MFRRYVPLILMIAAVMIDVSVVPMLGVPVLAAYMPQLSLLTVVVFGLLLGRTRGMLFGLIGGVMVDVLVGYPFGLTSLLLIVFGYVSGLAGRKYQRYVVTPVVMPLLCALIYELVMLFMLFLASGSMQWSMMRGALIRVALGTVLAQLLYLLYNRALKPSWSRYAGR